MDQKVPKGTLCPRRRIWSVQAKPWSRYTYRVQMDRLGPRFGGEGPRAEGVGGGKPPPNRWSDTPDRGSADLAHFWLPFGALWLTLGSLWLTFASLLVNFWCPLAHFWCLGLTFGDPDARFSRFWCPLASFSIFRFTTWMGS